MKEQAFTVSRSEPNKEACRWARANQGRFPIDRRPLKRRPLVLEVEQI